MKGRLSSTSRTALLQTPLLTPAVVGLEKPAETALALRTADLFSLRRQGLPLKVKPIGYQGKEGAWIVSIVFRLTDAHGAPIEGAAYLNPRHPEDLRLVQHLIKQDRLLVLFFTPPLKVMVSHVAEWTIHQRHDLRLVLAQQSHSRLGEAAGGREDHDFERVKQEFERLYSIQKLLESRTAGEIPVSSSFRGAVLD